jgi:hypothetical protein
VFTALALSLVLGQPDPKLPKQPPPPKLDPLVEKATEADPKDTELRKLMKERVRERAQYLARVQEIIAVGAWNAAFFGEVVKTEATLWENVAELLDRQADKVKCYEKRVERFKEFEKFIAARVNVGTEPPQNLNLAKATRLDAEIALLKLKGPAAGAKKDADGAAKELIGRMNDLAAAIEAKDDDKCKTAAIRMKFAAEGLKELGLGKEDEARLHKKYEAEVKAANERIRKALEANPAASRYLADLTPAKM